MTLLCGQGQLIKMDLQEMVCRNGLD